MANIKLSNNVKRTFRGNMGKKERVLMLVTQTKLRLFLPIVLLCLEIIFVFLFSFLSVKSQSVSDLNFIFLIAGISLIIFIVLMIWSIVNWVNYKNFALALTSKKVIICQKGRLFAAIPYTELETIAVNRSIVGRIFGYGRLTFVNKISKSSSFMSFDSIYNSGKTVDFIKKPNNLADKVESIITFVNRDSDEWSF